MKRLTQSLVLAAAFTLPSGLHAQVTEAMPAPTSGEMHLPGDEKQAKLAERYRAMLLANPAEGVALDRLWNLWDGLHATNELMDGFALEAKRAGGVTNWLIYGHLLKRAGRLDEAARAYEQAALVDPAGYLSGIARGELALARNEPAAAAPMLAEAVGKLPPNDPRRADLQMKLGGAWLAAGQADKAADIWEKLIVGDPTNFALRRRIADAYARNLQTDRALFHYENIASHDAAPQQAAALREIGRLRENRDEFDEARLAFEHALRLTSQDNWLHGELLTAIIQLYERAGRGAELAEKWRRDFEQSPHDLGDVRRLLKLAEILGDTSAQREWLEKILALSPHDHDSRLKLARLLTDLGERDKAAVAYDGLLADQPGRLDLLIARADLDVQVGRLDEAAKRLNDRLAQSPDDETLCTPILEFFLGHHLDGPSERLLRHLANEHPVAIEPNLSLAKFYLARHRICEAQAILDPLPAQFPTMDARMECWQRVAATYRDADEPERALRVWLQAEKLFPETSAPKLAVAELLLARGETEAAAGELAKAAELSKDGSEQEGVDRRLFDVLSSLHDQTESPSKAAVTTDLRGHIDLQLKPLTGAGSKEPLASHLDQVEATAKRFPTPTNLLRLARWQTWTHATVEASSTLAKIVADDPANMPALRQLADLATESKQYDRAVQYLHDLAGHDPGLESVYRRQLANLQMEQGDLETALSSFGEIAQKLPGSADALSDLALAQQRADQWLDALSTWKRANALPTLSPDQRGKLLRPLVAAYEHLGDFKAAAAMLLNSCDSQSDEKSRPESFRNLSNFCREHGLSSWLEETLERRLGARPDDYATLIALAEIRKVQGKALVACDLLSRASYFAPDPAPVLKELSEVAESVGEYERAAKAWRQLLRLSGQNTPSNLQRIAVLEEANLDEESAAHTWDAIVARFPRDIGNLAQASEFFERNGQVKRACELLGEAVTMSAGESAQLLRLGELELEAGDPAAAKNHFELLLTRLGAGAPPKGAIELPEELEPANGPEASLSKYVESHKPGQMLASGSARSVRLRAIRELAHLLPLPGEIAPEELISRQNWSLRWHQMAERGAREEPLMAFYESGDAVAAMDLLERWMTEMPREDRLRSAFLQTGLRFRQYQRLERWTWPEDNVERGTVRGELLIEAIQHFLAHDGIPSETMVEELFPARFHNRSQLWNAANSFAERHWYRQAVQLGERVYESGGSHDATHGYETARWLLILGEVDRARILLGKVVADNEVYYRGEGKSPSLDALRICYALLPESEQKPYIENYIRGCRARGESVSATLSSVILYGMHGDDARAGEALDMLLDQRLLGAGTGDPTAARYWMYVLSFGNQLQTWHLEKLAIHLWRRALRELSAFDRGDSELQGTLADIRTRLLVLEIRASDNPEKARENVDTYLRQPPPPGMASAAASQLLAMGQLPAAQRLYVFLIRSEPNDGDHWRNYLSLCEKLGDGDAAEHTLQTMLDNPDSLPPAFGRAEVVRLLTSWRQKDGDTAGAIRFLEQECRDGGATSAIYTSLAYAYENTGMYDEAARVWRVGADNDAGNAKSYRLAMARLEEIRGHVPEALDVLRREQADSRTNVSGEETVRLVSLYLKNGQAAEARRLADHAVDAQDFSAVLEIAKVFHRQNQPSQARELFVLGAKRCREAGLQFRFQQEWLQIKERPAGESTTDYLRGLRRLRQIALSSPTLRQSYIGSLYELARSHALDAWLEAELKREWRGGNGNPSAGPLLAKFYVETRQPDSLGRFVETALKLPGTPDDFLSGIAAQMSERGFSRTALPIYEQLARRYPQNEKYTIDLAIALGKSGDQDAAAHLLEVLGRTEVIRSVLSFQIADAYRKLDRPKLAANALRRMIKRDPDASLFPQAYVRLAEESERRGDWLSARRLLSTLAGRSAETANLELLVNCLVDSGEINSVSMMDLPGRELPLTFSQRAEFLGLIYQYLKNGRRLTEAKALLKASTDFVTGSHLLTTEMLADADLSQTVACIASTEQWYAHESEKTPCTTRTLAAFYVRWTALETNASGVGGHRMAHLARANQLVPQDFETARQFALLCWEQGAADQAAASLQIFLRPEAVPSERESARQLLAKH